VGLGAGGHAKVVIEVLRLTNEYEIVGLLDSNSELWGTKVLNIPLLGGDSMLSELHSQGVKYAFIGLGSVGNIEPRLSLYEKARSLGYDIIPVIHPKSVVASSVVIGNGPTILAGAVINAAAKLGDNVIVNSGAIVEHDCVLGDHVHIATGAQLEGEVSVGIGSHIGIGASVREGIQVGANVIVGAGAVVVKDVPDGVVMVGVPARAIKRNK